METCYRARADRRSRKPVKPHLLVLSTVRELFSTKNIWLGHQLRHQFHQLRYQRCTFIKNWNYPVGRHLYFKQNSNKWRTAWFNVKEIYHYKSSMYYPVYFRDSRLIRTYSCNLHSFWKAFDKINHFLLLSKLRTIIVITLAFSKLLGNFQVFHKDQI